MFASIDSSLPATASLSITGLVGAVTAGVATTIVAMFSGASLPVAVAGGVAVMLALVSIALFRALRQAKSALTQLDDEHYLYKQMTANYPNGVILLYDHDVRFFVLEGKGALDLGFSREAVIGRTMGEIFPADVWEPIRTYYTGVFDGRSSTFELRFGERIRQAHTQPVRNRFGAIVAGMVVTYDITRQKQVEQSLRDQEERLTHLALHDPLTNLANRTLFNNQLEHALKRARRTGEGVAVLFLDLDDFKPVNDSLGHEAGDQLLIQAGKRLTAAVRDEDTVARFGGDEFVILLDEIGSEDDVLAVASKVLHAMDQPFEVAGHSLNISASLGYSFSIGDDVAEAGELIRRADVSMYRAKTSGKHRSASMDSSRDDQLALSFR